MSGIKKGIVLAGGSGTRLYPLNLVASKQLQPVYDKPMIYYPLSTLMSSGVQNILIISTAQDTPRFQKLLGDGSRFGIKLSYAIQPKPKGIAQSFLIGEKFIGDERVCLILGDNIFYGKMGLAEIFANFTHGAKIFGCPVHNPKRYGVLEFDKSGKPLDIVEKPEKPKSQYIVPGLYIYDNQVIAITKNLMPSARGELEITDVNLEYLKRGELQVEKFEPSIAWLDAGTHMNLLEASHFIALLEARQGLKIGCLEEISYRKGYINKKQLGKIIVDMPSSSYREYLEKLL